MFNEEEEEEEEDDDDDDDNNNNTMFSQHKTKRQESCQIYGALNLRANTSKNYLPRKEDGRGLISAADCHHGTVEFESICSAESENAAKSYLPHFET